MVYTEAGEDLIASCSMCNYAANIEKATSRLEPVSDLSPTGNGLPELIHTPGQGAIADICAFLNILPSQDIKCVAFMGALATPDSALRPIAAFLRGDHQVNEIKLAAAAGVYELRPMLPDELQLHIGGPAGFLGPIGIPEVATQDELHEVKNGKWLDMLKGVRRKDGSEGLKTIVIMDLALEGRKNLVAGANQLDYHYRNVTPKQDFKPSLTADIRDVKAGEGCPTLQPLSPAVIQKVVYPFRPDGTCTGILVVGKAVEIGHIFKLGKKYTDSMHATVLDRDGKAVTPIMGSYGIGIERILTAAIETSAAKSNGDAYVLPASIAPFQVIVTVTNIKEPALLEAGEMLAQALEREGIEVLLDDRDERAGVKFKDADLIGVPYRIAVGKKLSEGQVELLDRLQNQTQDIPVSDVVNSLKSLLNNAAGR